jgi:hypothetical protein
MAIRSEEEKEEEERKDPLHQAVVSIRAAHRHSQPRKWRNALPCWRVIFSLQRSTRCFRYGGVQEEEKREKDEEKRPDIKYALIAYEIA